MPAALPGLQPGGGWGSTGIQLHRCQSRRQRRARGRRPEHSGENQGFLESRTPTHPLPEPGGAGLLIPSRGGRHPPALPGLVPGAPSPPKQPQKALGGLENLALSTDNFRGF